MSSLSVVIANPSLVFVFILFIGTLRSRRGDVFSNLSSILFTRKFVFFNNKLPIRLSIKEDTHITQKHLVPAF